MVDRRTPKRKVEQAKNQTALAKELNSPRTTIREWFAHPLWIFGRKPPYPVDYVKAWRDVILPFHAKAGRSSKVHDGDEDARKKYDREHAEIERLKRQQLDGSLVPKEREQELATALAATFVTELHQQLQQLARDGAGLDEADLGCVADDCETKIRDRLADRFEITKGETDGQM